MNRIVSDDEMNKAFVDYEFARAKLIQLAVAFEYIADSENLLSKEELAQHLQDISRVACAVTNQDNFTGKRYNFHINKEFVSSDFNDKPID